MAHFHHRRDLLKQPPVTRGRPIRWAKYYDPFVSLFTLGHRAQLRQRTIDLAQISPGATLLEVGCGTGDVSLAAHTRLGGQGTIFGIDPAPEMIAVARRKAQDAGANVDFQLGVIEALAFPDRTFDLVISSLMMHHLPDDVKRQGLAEIARVLKPGGRLLIVDFRRPASHFSRAVITLAFHGGLGSGVQELPPLLQAAGFTNIETGEAGSQLLGFVRGQIQA